MIHEIINPSDPYTIVSDDMASLTAAIFILGQGAYGTKSNETDYEVPITIFGGDGVKYFSETFGVDLDEYLKTNRLKISDVLNSVLIGSIGDREMYASVLSRMNKDDAESFKNEMLERKQTSLNGIGKRAYALAARLVAINEVESND